MSVLFYISSLCFVVSGVAFALTIRDNGDLAMKTFVVSALFAIAGGVA